MPWQAILLDEVIDWYEGLPRGTAELEAAAIDMLEVDGPLLGRPLVDTLEGSDLKGDYDEVRE